jgi:cell division protein FtsL
MAAVPRPHPVAADGTAPLAVRRPRRVRRPAGEVAPAPRSRLSVAIWTTALVFLVLFAAAVIQIQLIGGQRQLDRIEARITDAQNRQDTLRQKEASLRSPAQITQIATEQLGMVHAAPPVMVTPADPHLGSSTPQPSTGAASLAGSTVVPGQGSGEVAAGAPASSSGGGAR